MIYVEFIFLNFLYQVLSTVGVLFLFGWIIAFCRRTFCHQLGDAGCRALLVTGFVGTPIHELSHALGCVIFFHKINEICFYDPSSRSGALGYVNHSYNRKNPYQVIGNFFIGIAPMLVGSVIILVLMNFLVPSAFSTFMSAGDKIAKLSLDSISDTVADVIDLTADLIKSLFRADNFGELSWWIFMILALMIASHQELSTADINGCKGGLALALGLLLAVNTVITFINHKMVFSITTGFLWVGVALAQIMTVSVLFCLALLAVGVVLGLLRRIF